MVIDTISKDEVDALARSLLSYLSHYNQEAQVGGPGVLRVSGAGGCCSAGSGGRPRADPAGVPHSCSIRSHRCLAHRTRSSPLISSHHTTAAGGVRGRPLCLGLARPHARHRHCGLPARLHGCQRALHGRRGAHAARRQPGHHPARRPRSRHGCGLCCAALRCAVHAARPATAAAAACAAPCMRAPRLPWTCPHPTPCSTLPTTPTRQPWRTAETRMMFPRAQSASSARRKPLRRRWRSRGSRWRRART